MGLMFCYTAGYPFVLWGIGLWAGLFTADESRIPYLLVQGLAVFISIRSLRSRYRYVRHDEPPPREHLMEG